MNFKSILLSVLATLALSACKQDKTPELVPYSLQAPSVKIDTAFIEKDDWTHSNAPLYVAPRASKGLPEWYEPTNKQAAIFLPGQIIEFSGKFGTTSFSGTMRLSGTGVVVPPDTTPAQPPVVVPPTPGKFLYGINSFPWVPLQKYSDIGLNAVRVYVPWHWIGRPGGKLFIQPMFQAWTPECHGIDDLLERANALGLDPMLTLNQCPEWLRQEGNGTGGNDFPPVRDGNSFLNPDSYSEYGDFVFQYVARYGGKTWHPDSLRVDTLQQYNNQPKNQKISGKGWITRVQIGNEWDNWFSGFDSPKYMDAKEHVTMLYVAYKAAKRADPNIIVVMGGLTDWNLWYLQEMKAYADLKGWPFPCDVLDLHHYSNLRNRPGTDKPTWIESGACYPEADPAFSQIVEIVNWANTIGKKVIVSEFGADTQKPSMMHIDGSRYGLSDQQAQGQLIIRTFEALRSAGVAGAYIFNGIDDDGAANGGLFESSGIYSSKQTGYQPKAAVETIRNYLKTKQAQN